MTQKSIEAEERKKSSDSIHSDSHRLCWLDYKYLGCACKRLCIQLGSGVSEREFEYPMDIAVLYIQTRFIILYVIT